MLDYNKYLMVFEDKHYEIMGNEMLFGLKIVAEIRPETPLAIITQICEELGAEYCCENNTITLFEVFMPRFPQKDCKNLN